MSTRAFFVHLCEAGHSKPARETVDMMSIRTVAVLVLAATMAAGGAIMSAQPPQKPSGAAPGEPGRTTWFFYKVKWGFQDEFLDLFQRNHYPVLKARLDAGHYLSVKTYTPLNHGDGRADWTFAVELVERAGSPGTPTEQEIISKLYPDQATFRKEERRRFELLDAHWDVPLNVLDLATRTPSDR
jgi:hypothetical protein